MNSSIAPDTFFSAQALFSRVTIIEVESVVPNQEVADCFLAFGDCLHTGKAVHFHNLKTAPRIHRQEQCYFFKVPLRDGNESIELPLWPKAGDLVACEVEKGDFPRHGSNFSVNWWGRASDQFRHVIDFFKNEHDASAPYRLRDHFLDLVATERGIYEALLHAMVFEDLSYLLEVSHRENPREWRGFTARGMLWKLAEELDRPELCMQYKELQELED